MLPCPPWWSHGQEQAVTDNLKRFIVRINLFQCNPRFMDSWSVGACCIYFWGYEMVKLFQVLFFFPPSQADDFQYFRHWGKVFSCLRKTVGGFTSHLAEWLQEGVMEARRGRMEVDSLEVSRVGQSCFLCRHVGQSGRAGQSGGAGLQVGTELSACTSQQVNCLQNNRHGSGLCHTPDWAGRGNRVINVKHS